MRMHTSPRYAAILACLGLPSALLVADAKAQSVAQIRTYGPLRLEAEGSFFVGGVSRAVEARYAARGTGGRAVIDQMYVQYMIPAVPAGPPLILVHGFNHTGVTFETTPDGREGWATYFVRRGYPVCVVDQPARGRPATPPRCRAFCSIP